MIGLGTYTFPPSGLGIDSATLGYSLIQLLSPVCEPTEGGCVGTKQGKGVVAHQAKMSLPHPPPLVPYRTIIVYRRERPKRSAKHQAKHPG